MKKLKNKKNLNAYSVEAGDELYPKGIFVSKITRMIEYLQKNFETVPLETVEVNDIS